MGSQMSVRHKHVKAKVQEASAIIWEPIVLGYHMDGCQGFGSELHGFPADCNLRTAICIWRMFGVALASHCALSKGQQVCRLHPFGI